MADWRRAASAFFLFLPHRPPNDFFLPRQAKFPPHCNGRSEPPLIRISGRKTRTRTDFPSSLLTKPAIPILLFLVPKKDSPFQASRHDWQSRIDLQVGEGWTLNSFPLSQNANRDFALGSGSGEDYALCKGAVQLW